MTEESGALDGMSFDINTILVSRRDHFFFTEFNFKFAIEEKSLDYISNTGNNMVPYPITIVEKKQKKFRKFMYTSCTVHFAGMWSFRYGVLRLEFFLKKIQFRNCSRSDHILHCYELFFSVMSFN